MRNSWYSAITLFLRFHEFYIFMLCWKKIDIHRWPYATKLFCSTKISTHSISFQKLDTINLWPIRCNWIMLRHRLLHFAHFRWPDWISVPGKKIEWLVGKTPGLMINSMHPRLNDVMFVNQKDLKIVYQAFALSYMQFSIFEIYTVLKYYMEIYILIQMRR